MGTSTKRKCKRHDINVSKKGSRLKKRTYFPKGVKHEHLMKHASSPTPSTSTCDNKSIDPPRPIVRYKRQFYDDLVVETAANQLSTPGADGKDGDAMILRPLDTEEEDASENEPVNIRKTGTGEYNAEAGNLILEKSRLMKGINTFIQKHGSVECENGLNIDMVDIQPWGFFSSVIFKCTNCGTQSSREKLYEEVDTGKCGRKAAAGNVRWAVINEDVATGPTETQVGFAGLGIRVNLTGLQNMAVKVADATESLCRKDMEHWLHKTTDILKARGVASPNEMSAQFDVTYHSVNRSNSHCPGQAAPAATALCVETVTPSKKIVEFEHACRVCLRGSRLRGQKVPAICGHNSSKDHHGCTATIPQGQIIREYDMAWSIARRLSNKGKAVTHLTTDSDAKGRDAFEEVNKQNPSLPSLTWYKDPSHVSRNMRKRISTASIAGRFFSTRKDGAQWNYQEKLECRKALALDVPKRVSLTLSNMRVYWRGNVEKMIANVDKVVDYMIECYNGNHDHCSSAPYAKLTGCTGPSKGKCWFNRSHILKAQGIVRLDLSQSNQKMLRSVINMKLSKEGLGYVGRGETSSRCESSNRAINKSYAKNRKFWRVGAGRVSSAVLRVNNGFLKSTMMKFAEMNVPFPANDPGAVVIKQYQKKRVRTRMAQKSKKAIKRKHERIAEKASKYFRARTKDTNHGDYLKYQLDEAGKANNEAINNLDPSSSTLERDLQRAACIVDHMQDTLEAHALAHSYAKTPAVIARTRNSRRKLSAAHKSPGPKRKRGRPRGSGVRQTHRIKQAKTRSGKAYADRHSDYACFD